MELRRLEEREHGKTRELWKCVFFQDTASFLDYYYFIKARSNEIYVIEEEGELCSMLHLNPYMLRINEKQFPAHYIVAVSTRPKWRGRGFMGQLLVRTMKEMYGRKEPFTFLMPAAEAIYTPYDFRFIYDQEQGTLRLSRNPDGDVQDMEASLKDADEMAAFFTEHFAEKYQVYAERDAAYYQTLYFEQHSEGGGIRIIRDKGQFVGMFLYFPEDEGLEIREPLYLEKYETTFLKAAAGLLQKTEGIVKFCASGLGKSSRVPRIMARILHLKTLLSSLEVLPGERLDCSFAVLDPILTGNSRIWRVQGGEDGSAKVSVRETEDSQGVLTIGALTSLLFGYKTFEEVQQEENVFLSDHLISELKKLKPLNKVFLNEVV